MADVMFGFDLIDAGLLPAILIALPIVPPYLAYMSGVTLNDMSSVAAARRKAVIAALFFVMGLSTVFLILGFTASVFGAFFLQNQVLFARLSGIVVIIFGLHFLGVFRIPFLDQEARLDAGDKGGTSFGAYILGLAFAFGWTPCIGPQLGAILLLGVYAAGLGIPFLLAAMFITRATHVMNRIKPYMKLIERGMGILLVVVGLALLTGAFTTFSFWLLETFPALGSLG
jgi:cytochrome c-type biogenesis protein